MYSSRRGDDSDSVVSSVLSRQMSYDNAHSKLPVEEIAKTPRTPKSERKGKKSATQNGQLPHHKAGRVKVGIRLRPPFQEEIDSTKDDFSSIIDTIPENQELNNLGQVSITMVSGKQRDFLYDYVFGQQSTQDYVYDTIARPVVTDVLRGFNGTIFAYGQTGTGKTYTMGILEFVNNEHAGIIPRAISQIFDYVSQSDTQITITLSFLQLYRETIQDLLAPANTSPSLTGGDDNLPIREDPHRGFYVEGLQEYVVRSYTEAEALVNMGLENRAIAPTLMNATSSRSHTVLTVNIEQRGMRDTNAGGRATPIAAYTAVARTVRSKLLMVDLAGSERVRRTVSKGTRLSEAKSINTSLSALGNVIAALAETSAAHVPYRDSKLTRLLQDSLGGTASTALVATVGPAAINYGETLSTLLFATRCMAVKTTPIQHEELDYAEMCARLQVRVSELEEQLSSKGDEQNKKYEGIIRDLHSQLDVEKRNSQEAYSSLQHEQQLNQQLQQQLQQLQSAAPNAILPEVKGEDRPTAKKSSGGDDQFEKLINHLVSLRKGDGDGDGDGDIAGDEEADVVVNDVPKPEGFSSTDHIFLEEMTAVLHYSYQTMYASVLESFDILEANRDNQDLYKENLEERLDDAANIEQRREDERGAMQKADTLLRKSPDLDDDMNGVDGSKKIGNHLAVVTPLESIERVENAYPSNNDPVYADDNMHEDTKNRGSSVLTSKYTKEMIQPVESLDFTNPQLLADAFSFLFQVLQHNLALVGELMTRKDNHFARLKEELCVQTVERRVREEEVVNWSYILKYLLASASKLRKELQKERRMQALDGSASGKGNVAKSSVHMTASKVATALTANKALYSSLLERKDDNNSQSHTPDFGSTGASQIDSPVFAFSENDESAEDGKGTQATQELKKKQEPEEQEADEQESAPVEQMRTMYSRPNTADSLRTNQTSISSITASTMFPRDRGNSTTAASQHNAVVQEDYHRPDARVEPYYPEEPVSVQDTDIPSADVIAAAGVQHDPVFLSPLDRVKMRSGNEEQRHEVLDQMEFHDEAPSRQSQSKLPTHSRIIGSGEKLGGRLSHTKRALKHNQETSLQLDLYDQLGDHLAQEYQEGPEVVVPDSMPDGLMVQDQEYEERGRALGRAGDAATGPLSTSSHPRGHSGERRRRKSKSPSRIRSGSQSSRSRDQVAQLTNPNPSAFAQEVVGGLGVRDVGQASAAMSVIDRVSKITPVQLSMMDPDTRRQILDVRRELGLDANEPAADVGRQVPSFEDGKPQHFSLEEDQYDPHYDQLSPSSASEQYMTMQQQQSQLHQDQFQDNQEQYYQEDEYYDQTAEADQTAGGYSQLDEPDYANHANDPNFDPRQFL